jgi:L-fucose isomerase-like protein
MRSKDLRSFRRIRVVKGLRPLVSAQSARARSIQHIRYSEKLLQAYGMTVTTVDLSEFMARPSA